MSLTLVKEVVAIALYVLGGQSINTHKDLFIPAHRRPLVQRVVIRDRIGPGVAGAPETPQFRLNTYTYNFIGRALFRGQPIAGTKVILHVTTSRTAEVREALTGEDGSYLFTLALEGSRNEPIDWQMTAYTPDMKNAELVGRRISMREDDAVTVFRNLDLENSHV